ncbi:DUF6980 family protein [Bhargavaea ullalensis]|uniref:DUF6980 domain-containing protein n=1 Tax=Bhargavaea ullalensis TaxID=1265685 RepID=A0ABV2GCB0_9BACL
MKTHCCDEMNDQANFTCEIHEELFDCPDQLIYYGEEDHDYGLIIHDGGSSCIQITFCPWCGSAL